MQPSPQSNSFASVLAGLVRHPKSVLSLWNWKSAALSIMLRGPIFLAAGLRQGLRSALGALLTESIFCVLTAGFYGSLMQSLKDAQPAWLTGIFLAVVLPLVFQVMEYSLHRFRGTPHLFVAAAVSLVVSGIAALFNWYAMKRGALLVGEDGATFWGDLHSLPRLLLNFLVFLPLRTIAKARNSSSKNFRAV